MNNAKNLTLLALAMLTLGSCSGGGNESGSTITPSSEPSSSDTSSHGTSSSEDISSSTSSSEDLPTITFAAALEMVEGFVSSEQAASRETVKEEDSRDGFGTYSETSLDIYADASSRATGKLYKNIEIANKDNLEPEAFEIRKDFATEKYLNTAGSANDMKVFKEVTDYAGDSKDEASKMFVMTDMEAASYGLSSGEYITSGTENSYLSAGVADSLYYSIASVAEDIYISQLGLTGLTYQTVQEGILYSFDATYTIPGDEDSYTTVTTYSFSFIANNDKTRLLKVENETTIVETRYGDESDTSTDFVSFEAEITYGTQEASAPSEAIATDDYFLTSISAFKWTDTYDNDLPSLETIDLGSMTYVKAAPTEYLPQKAANIERGSIYFLSSSDTAVIDLDDSDQTIMEIVGSGTTTLTLAYFGKDENNIWREFELTQTVAVTEKVTGINFGSMISDENGYWTEDNMLFIGSTYTQTVSVTPSTIKNKNLNITFDDALADVTYASGTMRIVPKAEGNLIITFTSEANPEVTASETFTIKKYFSEAEIKTILTSNTWFWDFSYTGNYTVTLTFNEDGTGTSLMVTTLAEEYPGTFKYAIVGHEIYTTEWTDERYLDFGTDTSKEEPSAPSILTVDGEGNYLLHFERPSQYQNVTFGVKTA